MRKAIISHLENNNLLPTYQYGFLKGHSTLSQLLSQTEKIIRVLENGNDLDSIYLDFSKAFDKVDHSILCAKLKSLGIGGKVGAWLHTFLTKRTQQVSANGALSNPSPVLSGVPQGTVLGPILFIIMISDIDKNLERSFASLFADDSQLSAIIVTPVTWHDGHQGRLFAQWAGNIRVRSYLILTMELRSWSHLTGDDVCNRCKCH